MLDPMTVYLAGVTGAKALGNMAVSGVKATAAAGRTARDWLGKAMPLENPQMREIGKADFMLPEDIPVSRELDYTMKLDVSVPEELKKRFKLIEKTAKALDDEPSLRMLRGTIEQLNDESYKVLFVGHYNTGKSALLNKLLGREILKVGNTETTKTLTWLMPGRKENEAAWYHDASDDLYMTPLEKIKEIPDYPLVYNIYASVDAELLRHGAILIDTPGLEASGPAAALTNEALRNADAVILVVDHRPAQAHDKRLVETLKNTGKGERLFVAMNKMDFVSDDERKKLIEYRKSWLSEMGIPVRIFPLSHTDDPSAIDEDFKSFHAALEEFIDTGLKRARYESVEGQLKNTAEYLRERCEELVKLSRQQGEAAREAVIADARAKISRIESETNTVFQTFYHEINNLKDSVLGKWTHYLGTLKDETKVAVQNAREEQLNQPNQILGDIQVKINKFLLDEFSDAEAQVRGNLQGSFGSPQLPVPRQEGRMQTNVRNWGQTLKIPSESASIALLAYTFLSRTSQGFFATIGAIPQLFLLYTLSPVINKLFEQILGMMGKIGVQATRVQLENEINKQWDIVNNETKGTINRYFAALSQQVERLEKEIIYTAKNSLQNTIDRADASTSAEEIADLETYGRELGAIKK